MDQIIENLVSTLSYSYQNTQNGHRGLFLYLSQHFESSHSDQRLLYRDPGSASITSNVSAIATRNIHAVEVLDFDSHPNGNFIVFYKKITISHTQNNSATASGSRGAPGTHAGKMSNSHGQASAPRWKLPGHRHPEGRILPFLAKRRGQE